MAPSDHDAPSSEVSRHVSIDVSGMLARWDIEAGTMSLLGMPTVLFWIEPVLSGFFTALVDEIGAPLFRLVMALASSREADKDLNSIVSMGGHSFEENFARWSKAVGVAGWGRIELSSIDWKAKRAIVRVHDGWELRMQSSRSERWGSPVFFGKFTGIFSHAFGTSCWAEELLFEDHELRNSVELRIAPSERTLAGEFDDLRQRSQEDVRVAIERRVVELAEQHRALLASLGDLLVTLDKSGRITGYHLPSEQGRQYGPEEAVLGRRLSEVWPLGAAAPLEEAIEKVNRGGKLENVRSEIERDGALRYIVARLSPLRDARGEVVGTTLLERDLTEKTLAERALREQSQVIGEQREAIRALSTPILHVWEGVLALPLIGEMNESRAADMTEALLAEVVSSKAKYVLLDLTGIELVDSATADSLAKIIGAVQLLGASCMLCGVRPAVAEAMVRLGIGLEGARTFGTMKSALHRIVQRAMNRNIMR